MLTSKKQLLLTAVILLAAVFCRVKTLNAGDVYTSSAKSKAAINVPSADSLTLREQVGQTIFPRLTIGHQEDYKEAILKGEVGGFFIKANEGMIIHPNITLENQAQFVAQQRERLLKTIQDVTEWSAQSPHKIPLFLSFDYEGGTVVSPMYMGLKQMPSNMLLAATDDEKLVEEMYAAQAREILLAGANMALGPVADVNSNPLNPIIQTRSFGDNAKQVGRFSAAAVKGLEKNKVPAVVKHFPGHGDTSTDSHHVQPVTKLPFEELWQTHISAFQPSIDAGVSGVLSAHVVYPLVDDKNSAMFSDIFMKDVLRDKMGFKGVIATDGLDMGAVKGVAIEEIIRRAYNAGNNILLLSGDVKDPATARTYPKRACDYIEQTVASDKPEVSREFIYESAQKIIDLKERMGYFKPAKVNKNTKFDKVSRKVAEKGVTLVRDTQNLIPLAKKQKNICTVFFADGILGLQLKEFNDYLTKKGKNVKTVFAPRTPTEESAAQAKECMKGTEVVVLGTSRTSAMDAKQQELVNKLFADAETVGQRVMLLSLLNPYEIPLYPQAKTVIALYGPTPYTTQVAAEILLGKTKAKGKLPIKL